MYWREISHVKRLNDADRHLIDDTDISPFYFTRLNLGGRNPLIINDLSSLHGLLDFTPRVIRFELLPLVVQFSALAHPELDLHKAS